jgi:methylenetetrahydrofolate dehydrogenase (NADP+) / methenyltetrahydrofolate cyclohydrolase
VLVGDDPASQVYIRSKAKLSAEAGMLSFQHKLRADVSESEILELVAQLSANDRALRLKGVAPTAPG